MSISFEFEQSTPTDVWTVNHGLGKLPNIDVIIEENGVRQKILIDRVTFIDEDNVELRFSTPRQGFARFTTDGTLPFPAYDEFTITEEVIFYPNAEFKLIGTNIGRPSAPDNDSAIYIDPTDGYVYALYEDSSAQELYIRVSDSVLQDTANVIADLTLPFTGRQTIRGGFVLNKVIHFVTYNARFGADNPTSRSQNDFAIWTVELENNNAVTRYDYDTTLGPFTDIVTDGEFIYSLTTTGNWIKHPIDDVSQNAILEMVNITKYSGINVGNVFSAMAVDRQTGAFHLFRQNTNGSGFVIDEYNGTPLVSNRFRLARTLSSTVINVDIYDGYIYGVTSRSLVALAYKYGSQRIPSDIDPSVAKSLCGISQSQYNSIAGINFSSLAGVPIDTYYLSNHNGKMYAYSDSNRTVYVYTSPLDRTLENTIVLSHPVDNPVAMCVYQNYFFFSEGSNIFRFTLNSSGGGAQLQLFQSLDNTLLAMDVVNGELQLLVRRSSGGMVARVGPLDYSGPSDLVQSSIMTVSNWRVSYASIDPTTGHFYALFSQGGGRQYTVIQGARSSAYVDVSGTEWDYIVAYGNRLFSRSGVRIRGSNINNSFAYSNYQCLL